ncbi:hypothetical protein BD410DRAFT_837871 [Rickenella mellea]|uniref:Uncharacterized protein n=1 Tax=Rickenella mellea TaxID=50990 RepID=A0A4Y7QDP5_9AGAM|nr:hypothetical protein BD410DRAFT_837871 [Rickenella mellea]
MVLALSVVLQDVVNGKLEFRNPKEHLQHLVLGEISLDGWTLRLDPGRLAWIKSLYWLLMNEIPLLSYEPHVDGQSKDSLDAFTSLPRTTDGPHISRRSPHPLARTPHSPFQNRSNTNHPSAVPLFDTVPRPHLKEFVRAIQMRIHTSSLEIFEIEFTTCEEPRSILDESMTLLTPPFLSQSQSMLRDERNPLASTPLLTPLHLILSLFTSGLHMLHIDHIKNVSVERSVYLEQYAECLEEDPEMRSAFVVWAGINGWREEMLHAYWEAALFRAKVLTRWVVVFRNKSASLHKNSRSASKSDGATHS